VLFVKEGDICRCLSNTRAADAAMCNGGQDRHPASTSIPLRPGAALWLANGAAGSAAKANSHGAVRGFQPVKSSQTETRPPGEI